MNLEQRVILNASDISKAVNDYRQGTADLPYETGDYIYVGSVLPFNNLWFQFDTPSVVTDAVTSVQIWYSSTWTNAVDVVDDTDGFQRNGRLQWNTHIDKSWMQELKTSRIPALSTFEIYNMYWMRISFDKDLDVDTVLEYVGQKFSDDTMLRSFYPDLLSTNILTAFETGKTSWSEQHFMAAEHIVRDLRKRNIIKSKSQLLDHTLFADASCHKVAEIVYTAMGAPYLEHRQTAAKNYNDALKVSFYAVDNDVDGRLDPCEREISTQFGTR